MKKISVLILFILFFCCLGALAHADVSILLKAKYDGSAVKLRWLPADKELGYEYRLYRAPATTPDEQQQIAILRMPSYEEAKAKITKENEYSLKLLYPFETASNRAEVNAYLTQLDNRLNMVLFLSIVKPELASLLGQAYLDTTVAKGEAYVYTLETYSESNLVATQTIGIIARNADMLSMPWNVKAHLFPWGVGLTWQGYEPFPGFHVYRSDSYSGEYTKINKAPVQVQEAVNPDGTVDVAPYFYTDEISEKNKIYYYKVRGIDLFGDLGPYSDVAIGQVKIDHRPPPPPRPELEISEANIILKWTKNDEKIIGYNVYRAPEQSGPYGRLNADLVSELTFRDDTVTVDQNYFYLITAVNGGGYESLRSLAVLGVPVDVTPPPVAQDLKFTLHGATVNTHWSEVQANDLLGYRVYRTMDLNNRDWQLLNSDPVPKALYADVLTKNLSRYPFYYRITSVDTHHNESEPSTMVKVQLPDVTPPRPPAITGSSVREGQVALAWSQVHVYDLAGFQVYREVDGLKQKINRNIILNPSFVDANPPVDVPVIYTVVAVDETGNESDPSSTVNLSVRDHVKPQISSFKASVTKGEVVLTVVSKDTDLAGFDLFRSHNNRDFLKISHTRIKKSEFVDSRVKKGKRYFYKVILWDQAANKTESTVREVRVAK
jgi:fibronectin type 3 domain-containing protein